MDQYAQIIDSLGKGACLFLNGNDPQYQSQYLDTDDAARAYAGLSNNGQTV
jgi:hypothetical protein